jgi:anti-sigma B factor antagonist
MNLEKRVLNDIHVLTPLKSLMGGEETRELTAAIQEVAAGGTPKIVIDLGKVSFLNSTGLGALVAGHVSCNNRQGWFRVARTTKRIDNLFLITKLSFVFETFDTVEEALVGTNREETSNGGGK